MEHLKSRGELPEGGEDAVVIEAHDTSFYHNQILKSKYGVDNEAIKVITEAAPPHWFAIVTTMRPFCKF